MYTTGEHDRRKPHSPDERPVRSARPKDMLTLLLPVIGFASLVASTAITLGDNRSDIRRHSEDIARINVILAERARDDVENAKIMATQEDIERLEAKLDALIQMRSR